MIKCLSYGNTVSGRAKESLGHWPPKPGLFPRHAGCLLLLGPQRHDDATKEEGTCLYVLEQRSLLDGAWCVGPFTCNKSSPLKSVSEVMGGGGLSVVWLFGSLWFMTRPCSLINFNANSVWRDLWPSRTKNDLSYSLAWSCSEAKAECFIFQTADFLFNSPSLETEIKVRHWKMILTFLVAESYLEFKE